MEFLVLMKSKAEAKLHSLLIL